jgi:hypothetical protein
MGQSLGNDRLSQWGNDLSIVNRIETGSCLQRLPITDGKIDEIYFKTTNLSLLTNIPESSYTPEVEFNLIL